MRRHEVDVLSLLIGLLFVGSAVLWRVADDPGELLDSWPVPALLIAVGVIGLVTSLTRRRDHDHS